MNKITTKVVGRSALAAALSLGLSTGIVGVASASTVTHHPLNHAGHEGRPFQHQLRGVVSAYTAGSSISITAPGASTPTVYTLTSATTIVGLASGATLAAGAHVGLVLSSTTPATVTTILVAPARMDAIRGVVSAYTAGSSISITAPGASTPTVYTLTSATTIVGLASGATLAAGAHVGLVLSSTTPATVTTILVAPARMDAIRGVVSAYTAGSSISITAPGASTPTVYTLTSATTIVGLASGATLAAGAHVGLVLSSTTPATVTTILVGMRGEGEGFGHPESNMPGMNMGGFNHDGNNGGGSSQRGGGRR